MGLFGKKKKKTCAICGAEMNMFTSNPLADDHEICNDCADRVREWPEQKLVAQYTLEEVEYILARMDETDESKIARLSTFGEDFKVMLDVLHSSIYYLDLDDGVSSEANRILGDTYIVEGVQQLGILYKGDIVTVIAGDERFEAEVVMAGEKTHDQWANQFYYWKEGTTQGKNAIVFLRVETYDLGKLITKGCYIVQ